MEIFIEESTMILPAQETPKHCLQTCDLDLLVPAAHIPAVHFYRRPNVSSNFFEAGLLKEALSKVLVPFYPMAGRLGKDENGRLEIHCNGEGVLFIEAETNCVIDDFGDFTSNFKLVELVPTFDYTKHVSSYPLLGIQVTRFKCGGACFGIRFHHTLGDATSKYHFINSWAKMTRGLPISIPPVVDRTVLRIGVPTSPACHHIEYDPPPSINTPTQNIELQSNPGSFSTIILKLSLHQINYLKEQSKHGSTVKYSRLEILAAHIWRCMCKARGLSADQASKLNIPLNGRSRLNPPIPPEYIGNVVFSAAAMALSGDILSEPLNSTVERVHKTLKRMDDAYLKSALAYLNQQPDPTVLRRGAHTFKSPNLNVVKLNDMSMHDANFGWGKPVFARPVNASFEGIAYILGSPTGDGSLSVVVNIETHHAKLFEKLFYEVFLKHQNARSKY